MSPPHTAPRIQHYSSLNFERQAHPKHCARDQVNGIEPTSSSFPLTCALLTEGHPLFLTIKYSDVKKMISMAAMQTPNAIRSSFLESASRIPLLNSQLIIYQPCGTGMQDNNVPTAQCPNAAGVFFVETTEWND
jgi:hypothetical protein